MRGTMRVFDKYTFNIVDKVKFKDTKKYLDDMLTELGLRYNNVAFTFQKFLTKLDKVTEKYPNLDKYRYGYYQYNGEEVLTSLTPNWASGAIHADPQDWDAIFSVVSKIPRGLNIIPTLALDQIDWYGEGVKEAALSVHEITENKAVLCSNRFAINSQIIMEREYDHGNKFNIVHVVVEATAQDEPRDTTDIIKKLEPYLGQPSSCARICRYPVEQDKWYEKKAEEYRKKLDALTRELFPRKWTDEEVFIPNLADKKKIKNAFKGTDFVLGDRKGLLPRLNRVVCVDKYNHHFEVLFDREQSSPDYFYFYIYMTGHNFTIYGTQNAAYASSEEEAVTMLSKIANICMEIKEEYGELLAKDFGATPEWYTYS